jgi:magnesium-transporting ATPase (P-type)
MSTELGKISDMLSEAADLDTPLTQKLGVIGNYLTIGIVVLTLVIMVIGTMRATPMELIWFWR